MFSNFSFENRAIWINNVEPGSQYVIIWLMRIACWIPKARNAPSDCVMLVLFHCNNGCTNAPQCYVKRTLPALFDAELSISRIA
jgi:hypothetical protein